MWTWQVRDSWPTFSVLRRTFTGENGRRKRILMTSFFFIFQKSSRILKKYIFVDLISIDSDLVKRILISHQFLNFDQDSYYSESFTFLLSFSTSLQVPSR